MGQRFSQRRKNILFNNILVYCSISEPKTARENIIYTNTPSSIYSTSSYIQEGNFCLTYMLAVKAKYIKLIVAEEDPCSVFLGSKEMLCSITFFNVRSASCHVTLLSNNKLRMLSAVFITNESVFLSLLLDTRVAKNEGILLYIGRYLFSLSGTKSTLKYVGLLIWKNLEESMAVLKITF